jgi:hypothetical protein
MSEAGATSSPSQLNCRGFDIARPNRGPPDATPVPPQPTPAPAVATAGCHSTAQGSAAVLRLGRWSSGTGADVYVWRSGWERAVRVTDAHADLFAGWFGGKILISEFMSPVAAPVSEPSPDGSPAVEVSPTAEATPAPPIDLVRHDQSPPRCCRSTALCSCRPSIHRQFGHWSGTDLQLRCRMREAGSGRSLPDAWSTDGGMASSRLSAAVTDSRRADGQSAAGWGRAGTVKRWCALGCPRPQRAV